MVFSIHMMGVAADVGDMILFMEKWSGRSANRAYYLRNGGTNDMAAVGFA
ncbi:MULTISPECIES: hypothetical protein [Geobacillus]|nr:MULTISPECIES: hypothetical protein [Geobacillus]